MMPRAPSAGRDRCRQRFGQGQNFGPRLRGRGAVAGDDRHPPGCGKRRGGALDVALVGDWPVRRDPPSLGIDGRRLAGLAEFDDVALQAAEIKMGWPWGVGQSRAPGMAEQARQFGGRIDRARKLGHRREQRGVGDFLIAVAVLERRLLAPGQRHHRNAAEIGVLESGSEVGGADRLRHAQPRPPGDTGIAIGHIGGRLLRMGEDTGHAQILELHQGAAHAGFDEEDMRHPGPGQCPRQPLRAVHRSRFAQCQCLP